MSGTTIVSTLDVGRDVWMQVIQDNMGAFPSTFNRFLRVFKSRQSSEFVKTLTGFPLPVLTNESAKPTLQSRRKLYTQEKTPVKWQVAYEKTDEAKFKDPTRTLAQDAALAAEAIAHGREKRAADLFNYAATSGYTGPDSQTLMYTAHPTNGGPTYANCTSTSSGVALSASALNSAKQGARSQVDGQNKKRTPILQWTLVVGYANIFYAEELAGSTLMPDTADNNINSARMKVAAAPLVLDYWDANSGLGWGIIPTDVSKSPLYKIQGMPLETEALRLTKGADLYKTFEEDVHGWFHGWDMWLDLGA